MFPVTPPYTHVNARKVECIFLLLSRWWWWRKISHMNHSEWKNVLFCFFTQQNFLQKPNKKKWHWFTQQTQLLTIITSKWQNMMWQTDCLLLKLSKLLTKMVTLKQDGKSFFFYRRKKVVKSFLLVPESFHLLLEPYKKFTIHGDFTILNVQPFKQSYANPRESDDSIVHALLLPPRARFYVFIMKNCVVTGRDFFLLRS